MIGNKVIRMALTLTATICCNAYAGSITLDDKALLSGPAVTFDDVVIPGGTQLNNQFVQDGITFTGMARGNACPTSFSNVVNMSANKIYSLQKCSPADGVLSQFSIKMAEEVGRLSIDVNVIDNGQNDRIDLLDKGRLITSFVPFRLPTNFHDCTNLACWTVSGARGILNIDGYVFDELRFTEVGTDNSYIVMDNLRMSQGLPEPGVPLLLGIGALGLVMAGKRRRRFIGR